MVVLERRFFHSVSRVFGAHFTRQQKVFGQGTILLKPLQHSAGRLSMKAPIECKIQSGFWLYVALLFFLLPLPWLSAIFFAASFHEIGHIFALKIQNKRIYSLTLGICGARIVTQQLSRRQEFFSAMAGPAAGFLLVLLFPWFPRIAFSALVQSLFNLLPIYPFDGGRVIRSIMRNTP